MAEELLEYRPGRWAKLVDGRIVGRATPEEVAAWKARGGAGADPADAESGDLDLSASFGEPDAPPARAQQMPLRPAFERRGRTVRPAQPVEPPSEDNRARPRPAASSATHRLEMDVPAQPTLRPSRPPLNPPGKETPGASVLIRRKAASELPPAAPRPAQERSAAPLHQPSPTPDRPAPASTASDAPAQPAAGRPRPATPAPPAPAEPAVEDAQSASSRAGGPRYWWIWNVHQQPVAEFLREWVPRYKEKFGHPPTLFLVAEEDLAAAQAAGYDAQPSPLLRPGHFYLGHIEDPV